MNLPSTIQRIECVNDYFNGQEKKISDWMRWWDAEKRRLLRLNKVGKFAYFAAALLQRATKGEAFIKRSRLFYENFKSENDINEKNIDYLLKEEGYRWRRQGIDVVMEAKRIVFSGGFRWRNYFDEAKRKVADDFRDDPFLKVRGVGLKVRNFALSLFIDDYLAPDMHIKRVMRRWGVLKSGKMEDVVKAAKKIADRCGLSLRRLDRTLWHFGRAICRRRPNCSSCPLESTCSGVGL